MSTKTEHYRQSIATFRRSAFVNLILLLVTSSAIYAQKTVVCNGYLYFDNDSLNKKLIHVRKFSEGKLIYERFPVAIEMICCVDFKDLNDSISKTYYYHNNFLTRSIISEPSQTSEILYNYLDSKLSKEVCKKLIHVPINTDQVSTTVTDYYYRHEKLFRKFRHHISDTTPNPDLSNTWFFYDSRGFLKQEVLEIRRRVTFAHRYRGDHSYIFDNDTSSFTTIDTFYTDYTYYNNGYESQYYSKEKFNGSRQNIRIDSFVYSPTGAKILAFSYLQFRGYQLRNYYDATYNLAKTIYKFHDIQKIHKKATITYEYRVK